MMDEGTGVQLLQGDCLSVMRTLPSESIHMACTSPPYFQLRSYLPDDHPDKAQELGLEDTPEAYLERMVEVFRELRRVLRKDGTFAVNVGDSYNAYNGNRGTKSKYAGERDLKEPAFPSGHGLGCKSLKPKDLMMMPSRLAIAMQADGWTLRSMLPFVKRSAMPESATDRPSTAVEYVFIFSKSQRYFWDADAVRRPANPPPLSAVNRPEWKPIEKDGLARPSFRMNDRVYNPNGRNLRNSDFYFDSLDLAIEATRAELAHLLHLREKGGLLLDAEGEPLALDVNPQAMAASVRSTRRVGIPLDAVERDTLRTTSPDCPVHGDRPRQVSIAFDDERGASALSSAPSSSRIPGNGGRHAPVPGDDCAPIEPLRAEGSLGGSSGSLHPPCSAAATGRSTESRRTGLVPATSPPCSASGGTPDRTPNSEASPSCSAPSHCTDESRSEAGSASGERETSPSAQKSHRTARNSLPVPPECKCEYYKEYTSKVSHFAAFPERLVQILIQAGCPMGGTVLDPFGGSGTVGLAASKLGRRAILIDLNADYVELAKQRNAQLGLLL